MMTNRRYYDGIVGKPDIDELLEHHGVIGMKWGARKKPETKGSVKNRRSKSKTANSSINSYFSGLKDSILKTMRNNLVEDIKNNHIDSKPSKLFKEQQINTLKDIDEYLKKRK